MVFDEIIVGKPVVEKSRISCQYTTVSGSERKVFNLIYKYEESVFMPDDPTDENLASMILAQGVINYGLFSRKISFQGMYDQTDRRFIKQMMGITAREILVKKFLEPNEFLKNFSISIRPAESKKILSCDLKFSRIDIKQRSGWKLWSMDRHQHAVMSSGGKDSLLTFGLLRELKVGVMPVFINESGRHWFTALKAYKKQSRSYAQTRRVWTNCDRLFNWMLRQMPFIRSDYQSLRSDEYPIRLWTVAVFLFGALPLCKKTGTGRILIGNEYDTSDRRVYQGITHYNGLYDQSRYFDNALSRYYMQKGWSISQFSIIRPLSEMLIEKILAQRYPDLLEQQMSCHATHKDGSDIHPCGKCEKCRRIVGMLSALNVDPRICGYSQRQIEQCLKDISTKPIHQEAPAIGAMKYLLQQKQLIPPNSSAEDRVIRSGLDVLKLRYDPERSPILDIPVDLRKPLIQMFLEHATGALLRKGKKWIPFDPIKSLDLAQSYPFELDPTIGLQNGEITAPSKNKYKWGEFRSPEIEQYLKVMDLALLPVGSIEQHGPHLPLDTDAFDARYLSERVVEACSNPKPLVLPLIPFGVSYEHSGFKGTIGISNQALSQLVYDIGISAAQNDIRKLVIVNGHGGNIPALNYAAQMINRDAKIFVCVDSGETSDVDIYKTIDTLNDVHAGEIETSTALVTRSDLVRMELATRSVPTFSNRYLNFTSRHSVSWYGYIKNVSKTGIIGDATRATREKGEEIWQVMIAHLVDLVEDLKKMSLAELFHRAY